MQCNDDSASVRAFDGIAAAGAITALRFHGAAHPSLVLPAVARALTLGAADDCDLVIPDGGALGVAPVHATIERTDAAVRVRGRGAQALYRCRHLPPVAELLLHAGEVGWIGGCAIVAMDERMEALRVRLAWSMGLDAHAEVDRALTATVDGAPLALVGPRSLDAVALARAVHDAGAGARGFVCVEGDGALPVILGSTATPATIAIELDRLQRLSAAHVASLFAPRCAARVIFLASDDRTLRRHLDCYADRLHAITLVPLARRSHELPRLLQRLWRDELGSSHRVDVLGARALGGIAAHGWRGNFDELRAMAARLLAYVEHRTLHGAACALGVRRQTLSQHLLRIGVWSGDRSARGC